MKLKLMLALAAGALAVAAPASAEAMGPDAASCRTGARAPAFLVNVSGFKSRTGQLRVQLYDDNPADFLAKGKKLKRIDLPVTRAGEMSICLAVPHPGTYAVAVRHDISGNGSDWNDGGGFSRNPKLSVLNYKPKLAQVAVSIGDGVKPLDVVLNYRSGLSIGPVARN